MTERAELCRDATFCVSKERETNLHQSETNMDCFASLAVTQSDAELVSGRPRRRLAQHTSSRSGTGSLTESSTLTASSSEIPTDEHESNSVCSMREVKIFLTSSKFENMLEAVLCQRFGFQTSATTNDKTVKASPSFPHEAKSPFREPLATSAPRKATTH